MDDIWGQGLFSAKYRVAESRQIINTLSPLVKIICRLSATRYLAENNPWPQIL